MTSKLVMLASWETHFMTSILVTNSQCVKLTNAIFLLVTTYTPGFLCPDQARVAFNKTEAEIRFS